ncbi:MAG: MBL fold metallo-hydrolase [Actinobacteria bacterium]|nr:MBL fold metallo-hydrolase [Actinomycetota bacterium]
MALDGVLRGALAGADLGAGFHVLPGQGNALVAETDAGLVLVDAGSLPAAPAMVEHLRTVTDSPLHAICYSHGHLGYNAAVGTWQAHADERGDSPPRLVAHENLVHRYARYRETLHLQARMAAVQFPSREGFAWERMLPAFRMVDPTETFADSLVVVTGGRTVEVRWAPSETDDAIAVWFPDDGLLYGGPATPGDAIPNIGTPLRTQRFTIRWADTLDALAALGADTLVTEFGPVVQGAQEVHHRLSHTAEALRWLRREVVDRMNRGMGEGEVLADLEYPSELFDQPWMTPNYGCPDYIARDLYREENGWWDRNPTTLHPAPPSEAAAAVRSALVDPGAVLERVRGLAASGETQLALHVVDLLAMAGGDDPFVVAARELKAELCRTRAGEVAPYVSRAAYRSSARLLDGGATSWQDLG